jgi:hypothetical protein
MTKEKYAVNPQKTDPNKENATRVVDTSPVSSRSLCAKAIIKKVAAANANTTHIISGVPLDVE